MTVSDDQPRIIYSGDEYLILYKPPFMHSAPLLPDEGGTLSAWCAERFPGFLSVRGKKALEGGLLHRLDYGTSGLVFAALTQRVMDAMLGQQERGLFVKSYEAVVCEKRQELPGFPPCPARPAIPVYGYGRTSRFRLQSGFRYYGAGRKAVRPVLPGGGNVKKCTLYQTEILGMNMTEYPLWRVALRLTRGFRHQVRCHLAWLGLPILGDVLYGSEAGGAPLALRAVGLSFFDPLSGAPVRPRLPRQGWGGGGIAALVPDEPEE
ncbi:MAG: RNA pseudouridine synthase [Spirochaetaceae bacterium]|jgi:23S rRNA pseudouridine1911/1915/1917 synthase|nr:RNA pseudouridine synthase [Spirochaetaceae bacterium]